MSTKFLRINGDYKITTEEGGRITLDTGNEVGQVVITGDLVVEGNTTTIETTNMTIEDNIIQLNVGEGGSGITAGQAGIEVERGSLVNGRWLFVDAIDWTDTTIPGTIRSGGWSGRDATGNILGIETVSITTGGNDFAFYLNSQAAKLYIDGAGSGYHLRVTEDDDIPNKRYVDDSITNFFNVTVPNRIEDGPLSDLTKVQVYDNTTTGLPSKIKIDIDGNEKVEIYEDYVDIYGLRIEELPNRGMEIKTNQTSGNDLILGAMGTGQVVIEDNFRIQRIGHEGDQTAPDDIPVPIEGVTVFANTSNAGATGLYFVNENEQRDELISRNRALLYSMIF
jgi:hypothetical protein